MGQHTGKGATSPKERRRGALISQS